MTYGGHVFRLWLFCFLLVFANRDQLAAASYLDEDPDEVFAAVYTQLGIKLPVKIARDPQVWLTLDQLKRESCDQKSIDDLALLLDKLGYRREAARGQYNFVKRCGAPVLALQKSVITLLKLTDYPEAVEVADEFVRRAPASRDAYYFRGVAFEGVGDFRRAIADYANTIELSTDKTKIGSHVFTRMANAYAKTGQFCEAMTPILTWVAIDPVRRDNSASQKLIADYEQQGNCATSTEIQKERYALRGEHRVVIAKVDVNGVVGVFVIDTGASYVSMKSQFADRAKIAHANAGEIKLATANGLAKGKLAKADTISLGKLRATNVPVVVQDVDDKSYGTGVDGLLGLSFLSRFEVQMADGFIEIRTRRKK